MSTITAEEARTLSKNYQTTVEVEEAVLEACKLIRKEAELGRNRMVYRGLDFSTSSDVYNGKFNGAQTMFIVRMSELGFTCRTQVNESQFVDIWLEISW